MPKRSMRPEAGITIAVRIVPTTTGVGSLATPMIRSLQPSGTTRLGMAGASAARMDQ